MKINIYYGGRGIVGDPTVYVIEKLQEILEELHVKVERFNLHENRKQISALPATLNDADGIILASTVEWYGVGGYMFQFLDACWLYGNKEKISDIYMCPIVMSTTYGEREGMNSLTAAWETLGGKPANGMCGYIEDTTSFELNQSYVELIEKQAENFYRVVSKKTLSLPASNGAVKQKINMAAPLQLTPQETEQLSRYASDEEYVKTQKEDIKELTSHFKTMLGNGGITTEDRIIKLFKEHFVPQKNFSASYKIIIGEEKNPLVMTIKDDSLSVEYGNLDSPTVLCKTEQSVLEEIVAARMTFQRAFMSGVMQVKGDFKMLRMLDQLFVF